MNITSANPVQNWYAFPLCSAVAFAICSWACGFIVIWFSAVRWIPILCATAANRI